jgi:hypothetical protein
MSKSILDTLQEELKKEDQFFRTVPDISNFIRDQVSKVGTKQAYFTSVFYNLMTHGYVIVNPLTKELITAIRAHLDNKEKQLKNGR